MATHNVKGLSVNKDGETYLLSIPEEMTGASTSSDGIGGTVPRPLIGDKDKFLKGDGTWSNISGSSNVSLIRINGSIENASGSYTGEFNDARVNSDMEAIAPLELSNPEIFKDDIYVICGNGSVTIQCSNVVGTSTFSVNCIGIS